LSRIHFAIDLIRTAEGDKQRASRLHSLETAALELDDLVGELLRYVRLETSEPPLERDHVELLPLAGELIEEVAIVHPGSTFEIGPRLQRGDVHLHADRVSLKRALGNLLANAARFGESRVVIDIDDSPHELAIVVDDDGPGIPLGDRQRVFEPFVRLEKSGRGAGLGLALVKRIAANHGGTVDAQESPLGGCRIRTVWPRENRATSAA
jgi:signal transduction histidine kinase